MNVPVYFTKKAKQGGVMLAAVPFLIPAVTFLVAYFFNDRDLEIAIYATLFSLLIAVVSFLSLRTIFAKYTVSGPAFILKDNEIETATGKRILWEWFDKAVIFTCNDVRLLGLHRKSEVKKATIGGSASDFDGVMFGFSFAIQFDQFSTDEGELIKLFRSKLPIETRHQKFNIGDEIGPDTFDE